jgi:ketosteroid isomerase-like protein
MTIKIEEVRVAGDWAFSRGTYAFTVIPKAEGEIEKGDGKYLSILEKQDDGSWKLARDCFNLNEPPIPPDKE